MQQQATVQKVTMAQQGPELSELVQGYWRLAEWNMTPQQRLTFLKQHIELGSVPLITRTFTVTINVKHCLVKP